MTRKELIEYLLSVGNDDTEVRFAYPAHDYWKSTRAGEINGVELGQCKLSAYFDDLVLMSDGDVDAAYDKGEAFDVPEMIIIT
jgi:hypothetical protein